MPTGRFCAGDAGGLAGTLCQRSPNGGCDCATTVPAKAHGTMAAIGPTVTISRRSVMRHCPVALAGLPPDPQADAAARDVSFQPIGDAAGELHVVGEAERAVDREPIAALEGAPV